MVVIQYDLNDYHNRIRLQSVILGLVSSAIINECVPDQLTEEVMLVKTIQY